MLFPAAGLVAIATAGLIAVGHHVTQRFFLALGLGWTKRRNYAVRRPQSLRQCTLSLSATLSLHPSLVHAGVAGLLGEPLLGPHLLVTATPRAGIPPGDGSPGLAARGDALGSPPLLSGELILDGGLAVVLEGSGDATWPLGEAGIMPTSGAASSAPKRYGSET